MYKWPLQQTSCTMLARLLGCRPRGSWPLAAGRSVGVLQKIHCTAEPQKLTLASSAKAEVSLNTSRLASQRAFSGHQAFRNERRPTEFDKKVLLWSGRFQKKEDIPLLLSVEVLKAAQNRLRIRICYLMIALTVLGCVAMVISGKMAAKRENTLLKMNTEKKAKWRAEGQKERETVAGKME
ncbi:protein FAM162A-like [Hemicordylus capensis]|uniref:protein FAM162A-like n=1 Tax=Hemicordylus capensis TaxID=884348 RepID=UPI002302B5FB|nr:protein FAM162A-like [Hemicordylus capensis]